MSLIQKSRNTEVLGACVVYPNEMSLSPKPTSCFTTTETKCNQLRNILNVNNLHFSAYYDPDRCCSYELNDAVVNSFFLNPKDITRRYTREECLTQKFGDEYRTSCYNSANQENMECFYTGLCPEAESTLVDECCMEERGIGQPCTEPAFYCQRNSTQSISPCDRTEAALDKRGNKKLAAKPTFKISQSEDFSDVIQGVVTLRGNGILSGAACIEGKHVIFGNFQTFASAYSNRNVTFFPYVHDIYDRLLLGSVSLPSDQTPKEHFVQMFTVGGHGINRPMTDEEIYIAHDPDQSTALRLEDITLMRISYTVEMGNVCDLIGNVRTEVRKFNINNNNYTVSLPRGSFDIVRNRVGINFQRKTKSVKSQEKKFTNQSSVNVERPLEMLSDTSTLGDCYIKRSRTSIKADRSFCETLGGNFKKVDMTEELSNKNRVYRIDGSIEYEDRYAPIYHNFSNKGIEKDDSPLSLYARSGADTTSYLPPDLPNSNTYPVDCPYTIEPGLDRERRNTMNSCCPDDCLRMCILPAIRACESGSRGLSNDPLDEDDFGNEFDPLNPIYGCNGNNKCDGINCLRRGCDACDCTAPWTTKKKRRCWSCGPYQIKWGYFEDSKKAGRYAPCCSVLRTMNWEKELCDECTGTEPEIRACCLRKHQISQLVIRCYWRWYSRNGRCSDEGTGICPIGLENDDGNCMTCKDLVLIHQGGPCGHRRKNPPSYGEASYWPCVKRNMCEIGKTIPICKHCAEAQICPQDGVFPPVGFTGPGLVENSSCRKDTDLIENIPPEGALSVINSEGKVEYIATTPETTYHKAISINSTSKTGNTRGVSGFFYPLYLNKEDVRNSLKPDGTAVDNDFHIHTFNGWGNREFYMPNHSMNHGKKSNGGYPTITKTRRGFKFDDGREIKENITKYKAGRNTSGGGSSSSSSGGGSSY